jgi:hypothetical protein
MGFIKSGLFNRSRTSPAISAESGLPEPPSNRAGRMSVALPDVSAGTPNAIASYTSRCRL